MPTVVTVLAVLLCVLFFVGLALGACLNKVFSRFALRLPWHRKTPDASVAANLETVSVDRGEIPAERPSMYRLISAKSEALAQPLITRLSGSEGPQRQESLAAKAPQRSSSHLHETGLVKLSAEKLKEHTRSFAISASSSTHTPSNVVAWDDGHEALRRRLPTGLSLEDTVSLTFTGSLPIVGSRNISMELRPSRDLPDADTHLAVLNAPFAIPESVEGEAVAGDGLSAIPSTFTVRPTSPQAASSPFAVMAGLAPFAADTEAAPPSRTSMQSVRTLGIVAPMASLRLPRELSQKSLNMDMSKAWSDAASLAVGDASKQAALSRLMTFDNPQGSRALDLDTMALGACLEVHMDEIDLAEQIGKGGFGAVYKGTWRGAPVAVKYGPCAVGDAEALERCLREVVLAKHMSHPNVVQTYAWTMLTGPQASHVDNDEDERRTVQRALQNNVGALAQKTSNLVPATSADLGPATPRHYRMQELYHESRSPGSGLTPAASASCIALSSPPAAAGPGSDTSTSSQALASRAAASLLVNEAPASPRARVHGMGALSSFAQHPPNRLRESLDSNRSISARHPSPLQPHAHEASSRPTSAAGDSNAIPALSRLDHGRPAPSFESTRARRVSAPAHEHPSLQRSRSLNSLAPRVSRSMDRLQQQMGSVRHRRRSMDSPMMRQALKDAARRFAEACANKESSELGSEPSTGSMQGMQPLGVRTDGPGQTYASLPLTFSREAFERELLASELPTAPQQETPPRRLPNLNIEIAPGLQTVISHTFSDIAGMNSPGDQLLAASPQPNSNLSSFSRLSPPVPTVSPSGTPRPGIAHHTPDSFNRGPVPGHGLIDGAAPTPIQIRTPRRPGERGPGANARARRRLAYPSDAEVDVLAELGDVRPLGLSNLAPRGEVSLLRQVSSTSLHSGNEEQQSASMLRARSGDTRRPSMELASMSRASSGNISSLVLSNKALLLGRNEIPLVTVSSPRRSQVPGSPFTQVQPVQVQPLQVQPSSPFAAPQLSGTAFGSERPRGGNSDIGDLEVAARACSIASVRSNASFNSEEGFGSPSTNRRVKNRHPMPELAESSFEGGKAVVVVIMEFCDMGTLLRAITKQAFKPHGKWKLHTTYRALLRTAQEVAKGMDYIHSCGIIHGDLKAGNVLLKTHRIDRRGYIAKVADFGLSRSLEANSMQVAVGNQLGTVAYTAPEIFRDSMVTKPSDVYAFGVLMWEIYHCAQAYEGMMEGQICLGVCEQSLRPEFAEDCPDPFSRLAKSCWNQDPALRPTFQQVVAALTKIETEFRRDCHRGRLPPTSRVINRRATATGSVERFESPVSPRAQSLRRNVTASVISERSERASESTHEASPTHV